MLFGVIGMVVLLSNKNIHPFLKTVGFSFFFLVILFAIFLESPIFRRLSAPEESEFYDDGVIKGKSFDDEKQRRF